MTPTLPRWAQAVDWVLRRALPRHRSAEIVADLHERAARRFARAATRGSVGRWYLKNAASLLLY